jgi:hypothetical protein
MKIRNRVGPARQPHSPNNGTAIPTAFIPRLLPCPPMALPAVPTHRFRRPRPPPRVALRGAPHHRAPPYFSFRSRLAPALLTVRLCHRCIRRR